MLKIKEVERVCQHVRMLKEKKTATVLFSIQFKIDIIELNLKTQNNF